MKMLIKALLVFTAMLLIGSCNSSTENKVDNEPDSTTQNFTFEEFEFGDGSSSSYFNDVWIFNENNIWAAGWVGILPGYENINVNIMRWNGEEWKVFPFDGTSSGIEGIWAQDSSNIYFASGGIRRYKNGVITPMQFDFQLENNQGVHKLWGSSESNIWGVGPWGTLVHYNGSKWSKLEFDNSIYFTAVTGFKNSGIAYALGYSDAARTLIYELKDGGYSLLYSSDEIGASDISAGAEGILHLADIKIWDYNITEKKKVERHALKTGYNVLRMAYAGENDIYYFGPKLGGIEHMTHYNGKRFTTMDMDYEINSNGGAYSIKDLCVRVLYSNNKAHLVKIKRIQN